MDLEKAQNAFLSLVDNVQPSAMAEFLSWINDSFSTNYNNPEEQNAEAEAAIQAIVSDVRQKVPFNAVLETERTFWPEYGVDSECAPNTTVHVDAFLYDDDAVEDLVEQGLLSRQYCRNCGLHTTAPLTFMSYSLSIDQLRYIFTSLLPPESLKGKVLLDVGSRLGGVLYAAYLYSPHLAGIIGVEINPDLCQIQQTTVTSHNMADKITVVCDDIRARTDHLSTADIVVLNSVFQFFLPPPEQLLCWNFIRSCVKRGAVLVTNPSLEIMTDHLEFDCNGWVEKIPSDLNAAKYAGNDEAKYEDFSKICLYQVQTHLLCRPSKSSDMYEVFLGVLAAIVIVLLIVSCLGFGLLIASVRRDREINIETIDRKYCALLIEEDNQSNITIP